MTGPFCRTPTTANTVVCCGTGLKGWRFDRVAVALPLSSGRDYQVIAVSFVCGRRFEDVPDLTLFDRIAAPSVWLRSRGSVRRLPVFCLQCGDLDPRYQGNADLHRFCLRLDRRTRGNARAGGLVVRSGQICRDASGVGRNEQRNLPELALSPNLPADPGAICSASLSVRFYRLGHNHASRLRYSRSCDYPTTGGNCSSSRVSVYCMELSRRA
jgi:hypothetical protein